MSSRVNLVKSIRSMFSRRLMTLSSEYSEVYGPSLNRQKDKLIELIKQKAELASQSKVAHKIKVLKGYYTLEMAPPTSNDIAQIKTDLEVALKFMKTGCYKYLTVRQAWLLFLVGVEVGLWFYLGETIGKMHIVGYVV